MDNRVEITVGAKDSSALDLDKLKARLGELGKTVAEARVKVAGDKEASYQLDKMQLRLDSISRRVASPKISLRGAARAGVEITGLDLALDHLGRKTSGDAERSLVSLGGSFSKLGGLMTGTLPVLGLSGAALLAIAAAAAAVFIAIFPIIGALTLITAGFAGLAAVAVPEITKLWKAAEKGGKAFRDLSGPEKEVALQMRGLSRMFHDLADAVRPAVLLALAAALRTVKDILPALEPLIKAAAKALAHLFTNISNWLESPGGKKFVHWVATEGPKDIKRFGQDVWATAVVVGHAFLWMDKRGAELEHAIGNVVHAFGNVVHAGGNVVHAGGNVVHAIENIIHAAGNVIHAIANVVHAFGNVDHAFANTDHAIANVEHAFGNAAHAAGNVVGAIGSVIGAIGNLIGMIQDAIGWLDRLFSKAGNAPTAPSAPGRPLPGSVGGRYASGGIKGAATGGLFSGLTQISERGGELVRLPTGSMVYSHPDSQRMLSGAGGGAVVVQLEWAGYSSADDFMRWLRSNIRGRGGNVQNTLGWP